MENTTKRINNEKNEWAIPNNQTICYIDFCDQ